MILLKQYAAHIWVHLFGYVIPLRLRLFKGNVERSAQDDFLSLKAPIYIFPESGHYQLKEVALPVYSCTNWLILDLFKCTFSSYCNSAGDTNYNSKPNVFRTACG